MDKKSKKLLSIILIIIVILILVLLIVVKTVNKDDVDSINSNVIEIETKNEIDNSILENQVLNETMERNEEEGEDPRLFYGDVDILNSRNEYLSAKQCIEDYNYVTTMLSYKINNQLEPGDNQDYSQLMLNLFDKSQIDLLGLTSENISSYAGRYNFVAQSGYRLIGDADSTSVILFGYRIDLNNNSTEDYGYAVRFDSSSKSYSIFTYDYLQKKNLINLKKNQKIDLYDSELKNNGTNVFKYINANPYDIAQEYLNTFKQNAIYKPELAYNELNSDYATKFGSVEGFKTYISNNRNSLNAIILTGCNKLSSGNYIKYVCLDNNNNTFNILAKPYEDIFDFEIEFSNIIF